MAGGDLRNPGPPGEPDVFDEALAAAVKRFQSRNGLEADGVVGPQTLAVLNIKVGQRIRQVELNLERWRWLPESLGDRYISVNTADFMLHVVEDRRTVLSMPVVVGNPERRTPVFSSQMSHIVVNPDWTVPFTIAVEDILPKAIAAPDYFDKRGISVYWGWDEKAPPIDPRHVDWRAYGVNNFPFRFVQAPGPTNALGHFKFMFHNKFAVYLHDTPHRAHFDRVERDFSSGCIRLSDAPALAEYLLRDDPDWPARRLRSLLAEDESRVIRIKHPMRVHLLYMTAWVDEEGTLQFRRDIYDRDVDLARALAGRSGRSLSAYRGPIP
jgi:murein L,D-transpeptidase YcbB/YkuD